MENNIKPENEAEETKGRQPGSTNQMPDEPYDDTGFDGTTNAVSENHQETDQYQIAIEDTMIGYDGDESQMDMDLDKEEDPEKR